MECKGIGGVGADIFLREVQTAWTELQPFADAAALRSAGKLDLPTKAEELAKLVPKKDFSRLVAALVRLPAGQGSQGSAGYGTGKLSGVMNSLPRTEPSCVSVERYLRTVHYLAGAHCLGGGTCPVYPYGV